MKMNIGIHMSPQPDIKMDKEIINAENGKDGLLQGGYVVCPILVVFLISNVQS